MGIRLCVVLVILIVLGCGVHLGRGIANVLAGAGWALPRRVELFRSLPVVLRSDAPAGLDGLNGVCGIAFSGVDVGCRDRGDAAGRRCVAVEAGCGPLGFGRLRGMASRGEAERLLGVTRLRRVGSVKPLAEKVP